MKKQMLGALVVSLVVAAAPGLAVPIVDEDWTAAGAEGWLAENDPTLGGVAYGSLANPGGAAHAGALGITGGGPAIGPRDFINIAGAPFGTPLNYATLGGGGVQGIHFDFYVDSATVPSALQLYFVGNGNIWFYDLSSQLATGWNTIGANFNASTPGDMFGSWVQYPEFGIGDVWTTDIQTVSRIGLELSYLSSLGGQIYGVDNFTLDDQTFLVPEPETYVVLGIALLSMAFVFRKRITDSLAEARAMIQM